MTLENPIWQQANDYSARLDRQLVEAVLGGGVVDKASGALLVSERAAGANFSVDIAAGMCAVPGTSISDQGTYLCVSTAVENVVVPAAPGSNSRIDLVVAQVNDSQITGTDDDWVIEIVEGTAAGSPVAPATPDDAIVLAEILVASTDASVTDSMITDKRAEARGWVPSTGGTFTGAVTFEVPSVGLLAAPAVYNPATEAIIAAGDAFADVHANLAVTATVPASGSVLVRYEATVTNDASTAPRYLWGVRVGSDDVGTPVPVSISNTTAAEHFRRRLSGTVIVTGLTPGDSVTFKWSHALDIDDDSTGLYVGGELDEAGGGPAIMEVWAVPA